MNHDLHKGRRVHNFFFDDTGGVKTPTGYILKIKKERVKSYKEFSRDKKRNKENKKDYTWAVSHEDIGSLNLAFSLRITRANSSLKC